MEEVKTKADTVEVETKKKRSRSTKKSLAAENEKRKKFLDILLNCDSLPECAADVLKEETKNKGHILKLSAQELEKFWSALQEFVEEKIKELLADDGSDDSLSELISCVVSLLQYTAMFHCVMASDTFTQMALVLNQVMTCKDMPHPQLQNKICELSEYCCIKELRLPGEFYLDTLNFLLDLTLNSGDADVKVEVKRMWEMHVPLSRVNLRTVSCEPLVARLARVIVSPAYLNCKEGRQFIAFTFTLDVKFIKKFHQTVKDFLPKCKKNQAILYGDVYYSAWVNGSTDVKQALETQCIQNLMTHMFTFPRKKQELSHLGQNVFAVLSYLHNHRTTPHFSKTLTELYMPLLWRHLRSGNNIERCNAAEVFFDMYPLEKPGSGKAEESDFLDKQHGEMVDLLTDNCHVVRIIAIKGVCHRLCTAWETFPQETIQVLMRNLIVLANDGSTANVRRTLYDSLSLMLHRRESATFLARILPSLQDYIHDENEKVRRSFVNLLCAVKNVPDPSPIRYWKIVPVNHLAARLELEGRDVGQLLSKLMMNSIYSPEHPVDKFLFRIIKFIETNPQAARRLFQYSSKVLDYKDAVRVMLTILVNLRAHVKQKVEEAPPTSEAEEVERKRMASRRKKRRSMGSLQPITENYQDDTDPSEDKENKRQEDNRLSSENESGSSEPKNEQENKEPDGYSNPEVVHALIDIVSLLWCMHSTKLADPDLQEDHENLLDVVSMSIPLFLKYYKGSAVYYATINLASLVPLAKLTPVSTVCSACVSHLKQICEVTPQREIQVIIHALCSWNRFAEIQDLVLDWLDQAFRCEGLNQSQAQGEEYRRKVRFVAKGGKPMLALRLLDAVFIHPLNTRRVMEKSYNQVHDLYVYLERIKILVERRMLTGLPLESPMLSDEFLLKCMYRYTKLILILHRPEPHYASNNETVTDPFDASDVFQQLIHWTLCSVRPMIPQRLEEDPDFSVLLVKDILRTAANLVDIGYAKEETVIRLAELIKTLLSSECSMWFVESSLMVVKHLKDHSEAHFGREDKEQLMRTVIPSLLSHALKSMSDSKFSRSDVAGFIQNTQEVKTVMSEVVASIKTMFGPCSLLQTVLKLFTDAMVATIVHEVKLLQLLDPVDKVQELPFVCGMLLSIMSKPNFSELWLITLPSSISTLYSSDANVLTASVSLLHTLAHCDLPFSKQHLCVALKEAFSTVQGFTRESTQTLVDPLDSDFSTDSIDVKKAAIPVMMDLAEFLNCPLV